MKDKLKAIACLGLAVCVASGLWACSKEDVQTEPESSNTTINYVYNGIYDISNIPEETLSGEMPVTESRRTRTERPISSLNSRCRLFRTALNLRARRSKAASE